MTPDEAKEKVVEAIKAGRVSFAPRAEESLARMSLDNPDFTVTAVTMNEGNLRDNAGRWIGFEWETVSAGFGETVFCLYNDGRVEIDNEAMSRDFIKNVLAKCENEEIRERLLRLLPTAKLYDEK
mgnify:CR=1 FL=1